MPAPNKEHIARVCEMYANGFSTKYIATLTRREQRSIRTIINRYYKVSWKNPVVITLQSKV